MVVYGQTWEKNFVFLSHVMLSYVDVDVNVYKEETLFCRAHSTYLSVLFLYLHFTWQPVPTCNRWVFFCCSALRRRFKNKAVLSEKCAEHGEMLFGWKIAPNHNYFAFTCALSLYSMADIFTLCSYKVDKFYVSTPCRRNFLHNCTCRRIIYLNSICVGVYHLRLPTWCQ